jgi:hypothetical protein
LEAKIRNLEEADQDQVTQSLREEIIGLISIQKQRDDEKKALQREIDALQ